MDAAERERNKVWDIERKLSHVKLEGMRVTSYLPSRYLLILLPLTVTGGNFLPSKKKTKQ